jgi:hypothetical protein
MQPGGAQPFEGDEDELYRRAPSYTFDIVSATLRPNQEWKNSVRTLNDTVESFGVERLDLVSPGTPWKNLGYLESNFQCSGVNLEPGIKGAANVFYDWENDEAEIKVFNDTIVFRDDQVPLGDERGDLMDHARDEEWRTVDYQVDQEAVEELKKELEEQFGEVKVESFGKNVIPPEIREDIR